MSESQNDPMFEAIEESARQLGLSAWTIKELLRQKTLRAKKAGRRTLVDVKSRKEYADNLPDATFCAPMKRRQRVA
jgi:excisionase family DNA binding protein